jgi:hypothetical protein
MNGKWGKWSEERKSVVWKDLTAKTINIYYQDIKSVLNEEFFILWGWYMNIKSLC